MRQIRSVLLSRARTNDTQRRPRRQAVPYGGALYSTQESLPPLSAPRHPSTHAQ